MGLEVFLAIHRVYVIWNAYDAHGITLMVLFEVPVVAP